MKRILWVDDDPRLLVNYKKIIELKIDYKIDFAQEISFAIEKINRTSYDLIILDIFIPVSTMKNASGLGYLEKKYIGYPGLSLIDVIYDDAQTLLRRNCKKIPIIICTGLSYELLLSDYSILNKNNISFFYKGNLSQTLMFVDTINDVLGNGFKKIPQQVEQTKINSKSLNDYYQKIRHDFTNHFMTLNTIFDDAIKFTSLNYPDCQRNIDISDNEPETLINAIDNYVVDLKKNNTDTNILSEINIIEEQKSYIKKYYLKNKSIKLYQLKEVCYDLNNLVSTFNGNTNVEKTRRLLNEINNILAIILTSSILDAKSLISDILIDSTSSLPSSENRIFEFEEINLPELLSSVVNECKINAHSHNVDLQKKFSMRYSNYVKADKKLLTQAIRNVVLNAIKYTEQITVIDEIPWITIKLRSKMYAKKILIIIESWGVPISENDIEERLIEEKGYRGESAIEKRTGTGKGLFDTKQILEVHDGFLDYTSIPQISGKSINTFTLTLPLISPKND